MMIYSILPLTRKHFLNISFGISRKSKGMFLRYYIHSDVFIRLNHLIVSWRKGYQKIIICWNLFLSVKRSSEPGSITDYEYSTGETSLQDFLKRKASECLENREEIFLRYLQQWLTNEHMESANIIYPFSKASYFFCHLILLNPISYMLLACIVSPPR